MARRVYTPDERQKAIGLAVEFGQAEAARLTGIHKGTIGAWCHRAGVKTLATEKTQAAVAQSRARWEELRTDLVHRMGHVASKALKAAERNVDEGHLRNAKDAATTMAILVDKAQLLSGGATSRHGTDAERAGVLEQAHEQGIRLVS